MRKEQDTLGEIDVPDDRYYGAQTQRAYENFNVGEERFPSAFIRAHALIKKAAARVHAEAGRLSQPLAQAIEQAADDVMQGLFDDHFPLVIWQSGSGTQTNMNVNEVIANRANELMGQPLGAKAPVHPNDHVNMAQSTNDTIPASMHIACVVMLRENLLPILSSLETALDDKAVAFETIVKTGRTHLQDATPLTLGQEFSGYADQIRQARRAIEQTLPELSQLPIGGTAVGTGLNAPIGFDINMADTISQLTGHTFHVQENKFAGLAAHDAIVRLSGMLKSLAAALMKIANDLRWLGSGPRCGLGELNLPANEPGSSIMPGKVNPTQCEMLTMVCCRIYGNDLAISMAGSQGNFELNVYKPLMAHAILQSIALLHDACRSFHKHCVDDLTPNQERIAHHLQESLMLVTALNPHIGYDQAAKVALTAWREGRTLRETALAMNVVTAEDFDRWVNPARMTRPTETP